ncbi:MAG: hypothetical protein KGJ52_02325, partial [Gammaproteobacteria bacterium]|nr:hypothetical protein [Gammaproteobacteria bacterium]
MRRPIGLLVTMTACVSACGGGSGVSGAGTASYAVGGTVAGLAGAGLVLQVNGGGNLPISADGAFKFAAAFAGGSGYAVTVVTQPSSPAQYCAVAGGSGTVGTTDVSTVKVTCVASRFTVLAHQPP